MSRPLALLRPEPGWSASAKAARAAGLKVVGHPLSEVESVAWTVPIGDFDALLAGSAAVFRQGGSRLGDFRALPVHAVGLSTGEAARAAGFDVARTGEGGLQALLDASAGETMRFLRLGGEDRVSLAPHPGQSITEVAVYRMVPQSLDPVLAALLAEPRPLVALHSAATARHFAREIDRLSIARGTLLLLALGPRVAKAAGLGWGHIYLAEAPSDAALLAKAVALCK